MMKLKSGWICWKHNYGNYNNFRCSNTYEHLMEQGKFMNLKELTIALSEMIKRVLSDKSLTEKEIDDFVKKTLKD
jgi:hypothetical protein